MKSNEQNVQEFDATTISLKYKSPLQKNYGNFLNKVKRKIISRTMQINPANKK